MIVENRIALKLAWLLLALLSCQSLPTQSYIVDIQKISVEDGLSPLQFIYEIRLQEARALLEGRSRETVDGVMYAVGFQKSGHFAHTCRKRFGKFPSAYFS